MKVLHVLDHSPPIQDGYSSRSMSLLGEQSRRGWSVAALTSGRQGSTASNEETIRGIRVFRTRPGTALLDRAPVVGQFMSALRTFWRLHALLKHERPDLVHAHSPALNGLAAWMASRTSGVPFVYEIRAFWEDAAVDQGTSAEGDLRYRSTRALENFVVRRASHVFTICEGLRADLLSRGFSRAAVSVVPNAVDIERFSKPLTRDAELASRLGLFQGYTLGFIGSLYEYEGVDLAVRAMRELVSRDSRYKLVIVGDGLQSANLRRLVSELGLEASVLMLGRVPSTDVEGYYSVIDMLVYPRVSMRLTETVTPLKPLEAMAQRRLVIASDVGGHRELIRHGETGVLFRPGDVDALVQAVLRVATDPSLSARLLEQGFEFVTTRRDWSSSVAQHAEVYTMLVPGRLGAA